VKFQILTTFPEMFQGPFDESMLKKAREAGKVQIEVHNLRDWTRDKHRSTDDVQYGGGGGMVMLAEPIIEAVESLKARSDSSKVRVILLTPQGRLFNQQMARQLARQEEELILICGHYKGVDERAAQHIEADEISIGDYIPTGGELPAMILVDAIARLVPGVVAGNFASVATDSLHEDWLLDCPRYTRPEEVRGLKVPPVLLSGNHGEIEKWRQGQRLERTRQRRPDLFEAAARSRESAE
jgi:tRNA (guanine37-N1)-methyltransferase